MLFQQLSARRVTKSKKEVTASIEGLLKVLVVGVMILVKTQAVKH